MLYLLFNVLVFFETFHMKEYGKKIICGRLKTQKIEIIFMKRDEKKSNLFSLYEYSIAETQKFLFKNPYEPFPKKPGKFNLL